MNEVNFSEIHIDEVRRRRKKNIILLLSFTLLLSLGFAYLQTSLSVNGTTHIEHNTWNVYFDDQSLTPITPSGVTINQTPKVSQDKLSINYGFGLSKPGDYVEIIVDVVNAGTIDAMVGDVSILVDDNSNIPSYLEVAFIYIDQVPVVEGQILRANHSEKVRMRVSYKKDIVADDLPGVDVSHSITVEMPYVQADQTASEIRNIIYNVSSTSFTMGESIPNNVPVYDNYNDAVIAFGHPLFLRHSVKDGIVYNTDVGIVYNNTVYYLYGFYGEDDYYALSMNMETLDDLFEQGTCSNYGSERVCTNDTLRVKLSFSGFIDAYDEHSRGCSYGPNYGTYCGK